MGDYCASSGEGEATSTHRLVTIYRKPRPKLEFDDHFKRVHLRLLTKIPGLNRIQVHRAPYGSNGAYLMTEMDFQDPAYFAEAMCSREFRLARDDQNHLAADIICFAVIEEVKVIEGLVGAI